MNETPCAGRSGMARAQVTCSSRETSQLLYDLRIQMAARWKRSSEFFDAPWRVAVPCLASGAMPEVLMRFESAGGTPIAHERAGGLVERTLNLRVELGCLQVPRFS